MVRYQDSEKVSSNDLLGASLHQDITQEPEEADYEATAESIKEMVKHYLDMTNPEIWKAITPLSQEYRAG